MCLSCTQLTDNVDQSTAGAVERFLTSCRTAILQANDRSDEEAIQQASDAVTTDYNVVFGLQHTNDTETLEKTECPQCSINSNLPESECCGHGRCINSTCLCDEGQFYIIDCCDTVCLGAFIYFIHLYSLAANCKKTTDFYSQCI